MDLEDNFQIENFKQQFENIVNDYEYNINVNEEKNKIEVTICIEIFLNTFKCFTEYIFNENNCSILSITYICDRNGIPIQVKEKYLRLLIARYFSRLNSLFRVGYFSIDPFNGQIVLKMNPQISSRNFLSITNSKQQKQNLKALFTQFNQTTHYSLCFHIYKLLFQLNILKEKNFDEFDDIFKNNYRRIWKDQQKQIDRIKEIINESHIDEKDKSLQTQDKYKDYFKIPRQTPITGMDTKIVSDIEIGTNQIDLYHSIQNIDNQICEGGFSNIYRIYIKYIIPYEMRKTQDKQEESRYFIVKVDKQEALKKISNEKRIINHLSQESNFVKNQKNKTSNIDAVQVDQLQKDQNGESPFIAKFYIPKNQGDYWKNILLMENYHHQSLEQFQQRFMYTMSLNTKIYIIYQIAMGLKYLINYNVCHVDLKPANILITKGYIAKISDFGESQIINQSKQQSGITMPYTAPEALSEDYQKKTDIFSFGILIYEFLFDSFPVNYKKNESKILEEKYKKNEFQLRLNESFVLQQGPRNIMKVLLQLIVKCLKFKPDERPGINSIIVVLRECLQLIDRNY